MAKRGKVKRAPAHYAVRDRRGRFKEWTKVDRSINADAQWDAKRKEPLSNPGYGHQADYPKKGRRVAAKGFYKDEKGRTRPITGKTAVTKKSLEEARQSKALSHPRVKKEAVEEEKRKAKRRRPRKKAEKPKEETAKEEKPEPRGGVA